MESAERRGRGDDDDDSFGDGASGSGASGSSASGSANTGSFECNICLDVAREAVVSMCGHLYCWPCIHQWLETRPQRQTCPVCKAAISRDKLVPLYGRGSNDKSDPRDKVPPRPQGQRTEAPPEARTGFENFFGGWGFPTANFEANARHDPHGGGGAHLGGNGGGNGGFHMSFGVGAFPFGFFSSNFNLGGGGGGVGGAAAQREEEHELLSKMFLVIAFVFIFWMIMV